MKKKLLCFLLCGVLLIGLTGCDSSTSSSDVKEITSKNYGDKYNYSVIVNGVTIDDWKVFYKDEDGIYIITSEYLPNEAIGDKNDENSIRSKTHVWGMSEKYGVYYSTSKLVYQEPNQDIMSKYFKLLELDSGNDIHKMVSEMLHSENWSNLVNEDMGAKYAIGAVPIEMFVASWNEKYPDEKIYLGVEESGYTISNTPNSNAYTIELSNTQGYNDKLYFPTQDTIETGTYSGINYKVHGYILAAPGWCQNPTYGSCPNLDYLYEDNGTISSKLYGGYGYALRPVVFIPNK